MNKHLAVLFLTFAGLIMLHLEGAVRPATASEPSITQGLKLVATIALPEVKGRIDHLSVDLATGRLFIAALGNDTVEIVDIRENKYLGRIAHVKEPQGLVFDADSNQLFVAEGEGASLDVYDAASLTKRYTVANLPDADNVRLDSKRKKILVGYGDGAIAVFDTKTGKKVGEVKLDGHPESFQLDEPGDAIYVNVPNRRKVIRITWSTLISESNWALPAAANFPMALHSGLLFIACREPARLAVLDSRTGKVLDMSPMSGDCDDLFFDETSHRLFASCGEGCLDVFEQKQNRELQRVGKIPTLAGARTSLLVPSLNRLFVAAPKSASTPASILVFDTRP